ncbi:conserved protein of unknown function [Petrocella atlantisensis]|uniref:Motility associated factor glycosyltransferase family protein n=1 Tax=Petrocella atlantisensis TaxID=2173034 RepID=A0A3P7S9E0_9FIRM|nr:6-hydroxymethylpterin diphosphokinase MptE-like protein [Petrocella atlantisensis]VDN48539.1 conserved protein of unknown function [Petrocella atlantisensis]
MALNENIEIIKKHNLEIGYGVEKAIEYGEDSRCHLENAKDGSLTLYTIKNGIKQYLHSKYNPKREAESIVENLIGIDKQTVLFLYGVGLGYHIEAIINKFPENDIYIYEPINGLMYLFLSRYTFSARQLSKIKGIAVGADESALNNLFNGYFSGPKEKTLLIELPTHKKIYDDEYTQFSKQFTLFLSKIQHNTFTNISYQKLWIVNCLKNLDMIIDTPNIINQKKDYFSNKPVLVISAGPSLNDEIEHIKKIKEFGMAYIFSVGSAINTLIHHGIHPDAACTYDPTDPHKSNQLVFDVIKKNNILDIPLIFGTTSGYKTIEDYPGQKYHMMTSQDSVSEHFLKLNNNSINQPVSDATTIAAVTLQLVYKLGFDPIILVGQNLAFRNNERHSKGISYSKKISNKELEEGILVKDVYGNDVMTDMSFNKMREDLEVFIEGYADRTVMNTTKFGANIKGTIFKELEETTNIYLHSNTVEKDAFKSSPTDYDISYTISQFEMMDIAYEDAEALIVEYDDIIENIRKKIKYKSLSDIEKKYTKLDKSLMKLEQNDFFRIFILPMNRVQYKLLVDQIIILNLEKDPFEKGSMIVNRFSKFIEICKADIKTIHLIYEEVKETILKKHKSKE